jgi:uncharacterized protein YjiS (DUF1127 family)
MACAGPDYSCNSLVTIRSPLGEFRLGATRGVSRGPRAIRLAVRAYLALREAFAHRRQRRVLAVLDPRVLHDIGISRHRAVREADKRPWR